MKPIEMSYHFLWNVVTNSFPSLALELDLLPSSPCLGTPIKLHLSQSILNLLCTYLFSWQNMQSFKRSPINAACSSAQNKHVRVNCSNNIYSRYFLLPNSFTFLKPSGSLGLDTYVSVSLLVLLDENIILLVGNLVLSYGLEPCH